MSPRILIALLAALACTAAVGPTSVGPFYDCNNNGIEDSVDIAYGSSADADQNGIPDECQDHPQTAAGL